MTTKRRYARPPIIEAVIELRFEGALSNREVERLRNRFKKDFPAVEERKAVKVEIRADKTITDSQPAGFMMTAKNGSDLILTNLEGFSSVRRAPYESWESFIAAAKRNFEVFTKIVGRKKITRIGTRFINRLDIPEADVVGHSLNDFFKIGISLPLEIAKVIGSFSLAVESVEITTGSKFTIRSGILSPALLDHVSINFDIDAFLDSDIPSQIDEIWAKAELLRQAKNSVFENSITDKLRTYFK